MDEIKVEKLETSGNPNFFYDGFKEDLYSVLMNLPKELLEIILEITLFVSKLVAEKERVKYY